MYQFGNLLVLTLTGQMDFDVTYFSTAVDSFDVRSSLNDSSYDQPSNAYRFKYPVIYFHRKKNLRENKFFFYVSDVNERNRRNGCFAKIVSLFRFRISSEEFH